MIVYCDANDCKHYKKGKCLRGYPDRKRYICIQDTGDGKMECVHHEKGGNKT